MCRAMEEIGNEIWAEAYAKGYAEGLAESDDVFRAASDQSFAETLFEKFGI